MYRDSVRSAQIALWKKQKADASSVAADPSETLPFAAAAGEIDASFAAAVAGAAAAVGGVADTLAVVVAAVAVAAEGHCTSSLTVGGFKP
ncbi:hypothetical protein E3N88_33295 [Mikania micrantha]|uniref:Uncharacterized protein n=1 Tax=Mikania micrantha TaxID=192012 RepID=A0A5N6MB02_9ASTR|nr:hypothetical protein E3N88_33295 [Mikania micrantha]